MVPWNFLMRGVSNILSIPYMAAGCKSCFFRATDQTLKNLIKYGLLQGKSFKFDAVLRNNKRHPVSRFRAGLVSFYEKPHDTTITVV